MKTKTQDNSKSARNNKKTLLIVDYNPANFKTYKDMIGDKFKLLHAENVRQLLRACKIYDPSLIILDAEVPKHMGDEALVHLRHNNNFDHIPVIAVVNEETSMGIYDFDPMTVSILKPFSKHMIIELIDETIHDFASTKNKNHKEKKEVM